MAATIKIKNSSTAGASPTSSDLVQGELAVNVTDKRLYTENASGTVVELGTNPSVPVTFPDGSASAPSLTNDGDTNTGLFFPAADTVGIATGGTERARVDSAGNLGLGVTPSAWNSVYKGLQIGLGASIYGRTATSTAAITSNAFVNSAGNFQYINSDGASYYLQSGGVHYWTTAASGTAGNAISFTQAMTLDASGNLRLINSNNIASITQTAITLTGAGGSGTGGQTVNVITSNSTTRGILIVGSTQNCSAIFFINGSNAVNLSSQTTNETRFSATSGAANTANVYASGSNIVLQNNIQATRDFYVTFIGQI